MNRWQSQKSFFYTTFCSDKLTEWWLVTATYMIYLCLIDRFDDVFMYGVFMHLMLWYRFRSPVSFITGMIAENCTGRLWMEAYSCSDRKQECFLMGKGYQWTARSWWNSRQVVWLSCVNIYQIPSFILLIMYNNWIRKTITPHEGTYPRWSMP